MAVFGAPVAHEDDAERAVRSGLRIIEAISDLNEDTSDFGDQAAGSSLGDPEAPAKVRDDAATAFGAYQFPRATSFSMSMSRWPRLQDFPLG